MRVGLVTAALALIALATTVRTADAKKFRYTSGPKAAQDTALSVADPYLDPIIRSRGPRVPYTNLQLTGFVADSAFAQALNGAPIEKGSRVVVAPAREHPLNFLAEHAMLRELSAKGVETTIRRTPIPDDSLRTLFSDPGDPMLEYTVASTRVSYLRLVGFLPGRVQIERQAIVEGSVTLRDPGSARVLWVKDVGLHLVDRFPKSALTQVEDARFDDMKSAVPSRNADKALEPVLVVGVVAGLVALFFQNRP